MTKLTLESTLFSEIQAKLEKLKMALELPEKQETLKAEGQSKESSQARVESSHAGNSGLASREMSYLTKEDRAKARERFYATKTWLENTFPKAFNFKEPKPLKQGIAKEILMIPSPFSKTQVRKIIGTYMNSMGYLKTTVNGQWRYDLNGEPAGEITQDQKEYAEAQLLHKKSRKFNKRRHPKKPDELLKKKDSE